MPTSRQERLAELQRAWDAAQTTYENAVASARAKYNATRNEPRRIYDEEVAAATRARNEARRAYNAAKAELR